jgi:hypothetical protein
MTNTTLDTTTLSDKSDTETIVQEIMRDITKTNSPNTAPIASALQQQLMLAQPTNTATAPTAQAKMWSKPVATIDTPTALVGDIAINTPPDPPLVSMAKKLPALLVNDPKVLTPFVLEHVPPLLACLPEKKLIEFGDLCFKVIAAPQIEYNRLSAYTRKAEKAKALALRLMTTQATIKMLNIIDQTPPTTETQLHSLVSAHTRKANNHTYN